MTYDETKYLVDVFDQKMVRWETGSVSGIAPRWKDVQSWRPTHNHKGERYGSPKLRIRALQLACKKHGLQPKQPKSPKRKPGDLSKREEGLQ